MVRRWGAEGCVCCRRNFRGKRFVVSGSVTPIVAPDLIRGQATMTGSSTRPTSRMRGASSVGSHAPPMIGERFAILTFGSVAVDLPWLAQLAPCTGVARTVTFVVHRGLHHFAPLRFGAQKISQMWPEAKRVG